MVVYRILFFTLLISLKSIGVCACTCVPSNPVFCSNINYIDGIDSTELSILTVVILDEHNYYDPSKRTALVLEELVQGFGEDTITLKGQDGWNCGEDLFKFELGDTIIVAVKEWIDYPDSTFVYYLEGACGQHYLNVNNEIVEGHYIFYPESQMPYLTFKENLTDCIDYFIAYDDIFPSVELTIKEQIKYYPIPVFANLQIESPFVIKSIEVYFLSGQLDTKFENINSKTMDINCSEFENGIYILKIEIDDQIYSKILPIL